MDNWDHESDTDVFVLFRGTKVLAPDRNNTENTFCYPLHCVWKML